MAYRAPNFYLNKDNFYCPFKYDVDSGGCGVCHENECPISVGDEYDCYCAFAVIPGVLDGIRSDLQKIAPYIKDGE